MYAEGDPDFTVDQGMYYATAANYGYYCTGYESPGEWENHQMVFGLDGSDVQYTGVQSENSPYIFYTPSYGYAQSPYNPYNPYIPGAALGLDSPFFGSQYYSIPHQNHVSSPTYVPYVIQPDISSTDAFLETGPSITGRSDGKGSKHKSTSAGAGFSRNAPKSSMHQVNAMGRSSERARPNTGQSKPGMLRNISSTGFSTLASTHAFQGRAVSVSNQPIDNVPRGILLSRGQVDSPPPVSNGFPDIMSNSYPTVHKLRPKIYGGRGDSGANGNSDTVSEQNRGPRTKRSRSQLIVKAYTTKAGEADSQGNIVINPDHYNKDDFKIDYTDAKFFVIKSYSEDDVHKSIKYSVWSSTLHGNKKLQIAYEDARRIATEKSCKCPIFLFFSVNASGLFCGIAEMIGPIAFHRDMDFWQQDKWSGSFPVKWHIIKDVPNSYFRHIILQNNENKPVTNSRDTQEIVLEQGLEMLKIFKEHIEKTSLLDDFMYYENRQRIMQEEKARLLNRTLHVPKLDSEGDKKFAVDVLKNPRVAPLAGIEACINSDTKKKTNTKETEEDKEDSADSLKIGSLTIKQSEAESRPAIDSSRGSCESNSLNHVEGRSKPAACCALSGVSFHHNSGSLEPVGDIVRVGSMPLKVKGSVDSSLGVLTVGTIPLDPRSLQQ